MKLRVNNEVLEVRAAPDTPLLWVLRDHLNMTGTKFGCGKGLCGACMVHADGRPLRSCTTPVSAVETMAITTIEGLGDGKGKHPVQQAWQELDVPQCGYCQSGQIMQAAGFLENTPNPTDQQISDAMNGNLCRCMAYTRIRKAIKTASSGGEA
jgi:isoquinoline 1-oxidoreductase alpha subunit